MISRLTKLALLGLLTQLLFSTRTPIQVIGKGEDANFRREVSCSSVLKLRVSDVPGTAQIDPEAMCACLVLVTRSCKTRLMSCITRCRTIGVRLRPGVFSPSAGAPPPQGRRWFGANVRPSTEPKARTHSWSGAQPEGTWHKLVE
jgi:hypothetical protein